MIIYKAGGGPMESRGIPRMDTQVPAPRKFEQRNVMPVQIAQTSTGNLSSLMRGMGYGRGAGTSYTPQVAANVQQKLNTAYGGPTTSYQVAQGAQGGYEGYQKHQTSNVPLYLEREIVPGSGTYGTYDTEGRPITTEQAQETSQGFYKDKYPNQRQRTAQEQYRSTLGLAQGGKVGCGCGGSKILYKR